MLGFGGFFSGFFYCLFGWGFFVGVVQIIFIGRKHFTDVQAALWFTVNQIKALN